MVVAASFGLVACLVGSASAAPSSARSVRPEPVRAQQASTAPPQRSGPAILTAGLRGANERPGPGDPDGRGAIAMVLRPRSERVCYVLHVSRLDDVVAGHIHQGPAGVAGPIVVNLGLPPGPGRFFANCVEADADLLAAIAAAPQNYYANVHTTAFPAGAIRGQLQALVMH
jgi:hypothetical protein